MRRRTKLLGVGGASLALIGAAVAAQLVLENGFGARDEPNFVDTLVARWWRRLAVPRDEAGARNPLPATAEVLARGKEHYAVDCAACHGSDGRAATRLARGLHPKPPDLTAAATQALQDGEIFWIIQNGVRLSGMPGFGDDSTERDQEAWEIVHFVRRLPRLSEEEIRQVAVLQPRSPREVAEAGRAARFLGEPASPLSANAHHESTLLGVVEAQDDGRLQIRTAAGATLSLLLNRSSPTRFLRGEQPIRPGELRIGERVVVSAIADQDWWLAREVRVPRKAVQP